MSDGKLEFAPSHDENARQSFVGALKGYANMVVQSELEHVIEADVIPQIEGQNPGRALLREDIESSCSQLPIYAFWSNITYKSQDMLFETVAETVERTQDSQEAIAATLTSRPEKLGSVELAPDLKVSPPISTVEIHRQPGGYIGVPGKGDLHTARVYSGTVEIYRNAKAMGDGSMAGSDSIGRFTAAAAKRRFPDLNPKRILDLGCGSGEQTLAFKRAFPDAEVFGLDASHSLVKYAHAWAESEGEPIHYKQANAQDTGFEDDFFDLIVSHILFHETSRLILPKVMAEARRILAPGGVFFNLDVPYQPDVTPLPRQVTNNWQVKNNGEPFWTGFVNTDLPKALETAGFDTDSVFQNYEPFGAGSYLVFGAMK